MGKKPLLVCARTTMNAGKCFNCIFKKTCMDGRAITFRMLTDKLEGK